MEAYTKCGTVYGIGTVTGIVYSLDTMGCTLIGIGIDCSFILIKWSTLFPNELLVALAIDSNPDHECSNANTLLPIAARNPTIAAAFVIKYATQA